MKKYALLSLLAFIVAGILFASDVERLCKNGWTTEASEIQMIMSFKPDGTALLDYKNGPKDEEGNWRLNDEGLFEITFGRMSWTARIEDGDLLIKSGERERAYQPSEMRDYRAQPPPEVSLVGKPFTLTSNENFKLNGDISQKMQSTEKGMEKEVSQLDTKMGSFQFSKFTKKDSIAGSGYHYFCTLDVINPEWHPKKSGTILGNISTQISEQTGVHFGSFSDSTMNEIGSGFVRLFIGEKTTLTLILIPTEMENRFHLCATITEAK
jgi:hypothetical protein